MDYDVYKRVLGTLSEIKDSRFFNSRSGDMMDCLGYANEYTVMYSLLYTILSYRNRRSKLYRPEIDILFWNVEE